MRLNLIATLLLLPCAASSAQKSAVESAITSGANVSDTSTPKEPKPIQSFDLTAIDKTVDPCTDFYQYSCGNWRKNNPIPSDESTWGRFDQLQERNGYLLYTELEKASQPNPARTPL